MATLNVLIAGGGIGGLTLAEALARHAIRPVVLERADRFRTVGAGITMQINATQALRRIGLAEAVEAVGNRLDELVLRDQTGRVLVRSDMKKPAETFGTPFLGLHRAKLHEALLSGVPDDAVTLGFMVESYRMTGEKVVVTASDGREVEGDILVGADGLRSRIRQQLRGDEPLRYSGCTSWRGVLVNDGFVARRQAFEYWGNRSIFGMFPTSDREMYWFGTAMTEPGGQDGVDPRDGILESLSGWAEPIPRVLEATPPESILRSDIYDRPPSLPWGQGRVTLLGDAAHPMTPNMGQGGGQAVEDAVLLAAELARNASPETALRIYEKKRFVRTKQFVDRSRVANRVSHGMTPADRLLRKYVIPHIPAWLLERQSHRLFRIAD